MTPRMCACPEEQATSANWPDDMHAHDGCAVYHVGKVCTVTPELPGFEKPKEMD